MMRESVHASVHVGTAIARDGDYFGGAVNLTARLLGAAGRDELVATRPVVEAAPLLIPAAVALRESLGWVTRAEGSEVGIRRDAARQDDN
jgi:class 3 adenylate cyclase